MMITFLLITLAAFVLFSFGALCGNSLETQAAGQRDRRIAALQREINDQVRALQAAGLLDGDEAKRYVNYEYGRR